MGQEFTIGQVVHWTDHNGIDRCGTYLGMSTDTRALVNPDPPLVGHRNIQVRFLFDSPSRIGSWNQ